MDNHERVRSDPSIIRQEIAHKIAPQIGDLFPEVHAIMLFGSSASNKAKKNSDIDLALITNGYVPMLIQLFKVDRKKELSELLATQGLKLGSSPLGIHLSAVNTNELTNLDDIPDMRKQIIKNIKADGIVIWQREP